MPYSYRGASSRQRSYSSYNKKPSNNRRKKMGSYIDPRRFVAAAKSIETAPYIPKHSFNDFALDDILSTNLANAGYVSPSPIQDQAIPAGLAGRDVVGIAGTGTGKTAAFALPLLHRLILQEATGAIIIAPTRELAEQIEQECRKLAKSSGLTGALLIGGTSMGPQLRDLKAKPRIVVGTPGRIKDHIERGSLRMQHYDVVVLDEVDRMLDMGFIQDIRSIIDQLPQERQSLFFSATVSPKVRDLIDNITKDPISITIQASQASENVHQDVVNYQTSSDKIEKLHDLLVTDKVAKTLIFDETQRNVDRLSAELAARGFIAEAIHGGKTQGHRQRALSKFKSNEATILVATDVAARGLDVSDITHVINYSLPQEYEDYIHRIGRAGRAGRTGYAFTFVASGGRNEY